MGIRREHWANNELGRGVKMGFQGLSARTAEATRSQVKKDQQVPGVLQAVAMTLLRRGEGSEAGLSHGDLVDCIY